MAAQELQTVECDRCGAEMALRETGSRKTPPIVGSEREWRRYVCGECGKQTRYERKEGEAWERKGG